MRGAGNRADAPTKRERRPRERTGEKKYDFRLCAQLIFYAQLTANDALKHKILLGVEDAKNSQKTREHENTTRARARKKRREHFYALLRASVHTRTH